MGAHHVPSENFPDGTRWAPNSLSDPYFRQERGLGSETGIKSGHKKPVKKPCVG